MSTRAVIVIPGQPVMVYKHFDGYPEGTLNWLEHFNINFVRERGDDPEYKLAALLRSSALLAKEFRLDDSAFTGWGVIALGADYGQEYEYTLHPNGSVTYQTC